MTIIKVIAEKNKCYQAGGVLHPQGIMLHSVGCAQPSAAVFARSFNQYQPGGVSVCVHAFAQADGTVYQTLPWEMRGWHCGSGAKGSGNDTHIGFEICEDGLTDASYFNAVYKEAVELCAYLCKLYGFSEKNIICHSEGYKLGIASNHGDVMHWFPKHGKSMDTFRADVGKLLMPPTPTEPKKLYRVQVGAYTVKANADAMLAKIKSAGFKDAFIKIE